MTAVHTGSDYAELSGGTYGRLAFQWMGDRFQHFWLFGDENRKVLESVESDHSVQWPVSPPVQQVYRQKFADGRDVMFAVGMAGRGHWSVSYTLVPDLHCWIVELACCSQTQPQQLSSRYQLFGDWQVDQLSDGGLPSACRLADLGLRLEPLSQSTHLSVARGELILSPDGLAQQTATTQWGFRLRVGQSK